MPTCPRAQAPRRDDDDDAVDAIADREHSVKLTIIGCGDAFGSGGRLQSAYILDHRGGSVLIDCGATTTMGLSSADIDPNGIPDIVISHLHGDHYAGVIWFIMHAVVVAKRDQPLAIHGPPGVEARITATGELLYPGMFKMARKFSIDFHEMAVAMPSRINGLDISVFEVVHASGAPSHALRCSSEGRILAFSGDTTWTDTLVDVGRNADLFLTECCEFDRATAMHIRWTELQPNLDRIGAKRVVLTHMSTDMLRRRGEISDARVTFAEDGAVYDF